MFRSLARLVSVITLFLCSTAMAAPQTVDTGPCFKVIAQPKSGKAYTASLGEGKSMVLLYEPGAAGAMPDEFIAVKGETPLADDTCKDGVARTFPVNQGYQATIPPDALTKAGRVLVATFVLALLLESAFELLFNWRLFQAFFVGRAWRTPIMFGISLALVRLFNLDLMSSLFRAYHGVLPAEAQDSWLTSCLTAMIVSGGSVGVNKLLVALQFRSPLQRVEQEAVKLGPQDAWVSIEVRGAARGEQYRVNMTAVTCAETPQTPETLAILGTPASGRLRRLMFPNSFRTPSSGGMRVAANTCYRITLTNRLGETFDVNGKLVKNGEVDPLRFAPRAIVDFVLFIQDAA